jgi:hypothetical protein
MAVCDTIAKLRKRYTDFKARALKKPESQPDSGLLVGTSPTFICLGADR